MAFVTHRAQPGEKVGKHQEKEQQSKAWQGKRGKGSQVLMEAAVKSCETLWIWQSQAKQPCRPWSSKKAAALGTETVALSLPG